MATNRVARAQRVQSVLLQATLDRESLYAHISLPVIVGVAASVLLVLLLILCAKVCYARRRKKRAAGFKDPPTPPTPRLTQYELPQDQEEMDDVDECRCAAKGRRVVWSYVYNLCIW